MWSIAPMLITANQPPALSFRPMHPVIPTEGRNLLPAGTCSRSNPLLRHDNRPDDRHQQQQGSDFEGKHIRSVRPVKQQSRDRLGILRFSVGHLTFGEERLAFWG